MPIIDQALRLGIEIEVASSGGALQLLQKRFPHLVYHELPSYRVRYPSRLPTWNFLFLLPRLLYVVWLEQRILRKLLNRQAYDLLISDNRLGCYSRRVYGVYLTHQLQFAFRQKWISGITARMHAFWYRRFREIWVPDFPPPDNLSGQLAIPLSGDEPLYIGPLSQLSLLQLSQKKRRYDAAAILSGPEPQRSYLEREIIEQMSKLAGHFLLVRGLPQGKKTPHTTDNVEVLSFAGADELAYIMAQSSLIICRSGYSSIMDLYHLQQKALLIPTPGQPEQEYLAKWHCGKDQFLVQEQGQLDIKAAMLFAKAA